MLEKNLSVKIWTFWVSTRNYASNDFSRTNCPTLKFSSREAKFSYFYALAFFLPIKICLKHLKIKVAKLIEKNVEGCKITEGKGTDADKRDYEVSYARIKALGHQTVTVWKYALSKIYHKKIWYTILLTAAFQVSVEEGIKELLKIIPHLSDSELKIMKNVWTHVNLISESNFCMTLSFESTELLRVLALNNLDISDLLRYF